MSPPPTRDTDLAAAFTAWLDSHSVERFGFKLSDLRQAEARLARLLTCDTRTPEGDAELARLIAAYREKWRPCRLSIDDPFIAERE